MIKGGGVVKTFDNVFVNTIGFSKPSKLIQRWRYVNTNIKIKDLSFNWNAIPNLST